VGSSPVTAVGESPSEQAFPVPLASSTLIFGSVLELRRLPENNPEGYRGDLSSKTEPKIKVLARDTGTLITQELGGTPARVAGYC
jgi:hypothetical protein